MRALAAFAIALLGPLVVTEATGSPLLDAALDERIVGGQEVARNTIPWQVALVNTMSMSKRPDCGGTILCSRYILTAAHCTAGKSAWQLEVMAGEHDHVATDGTETAHRVRKIIDHPFYYKTARYGYDFSILELEDPIDLSSNSYARPACLPSSHDTDFNENTKFTVSGWGRLSGFSAGPRSLHSVELPWVPLSDVEDFFELGAFWATNEDELNTHTMIGAGTMEWGGVSACKGDSGGPMTWKDPSTSRNKLVGVVSFGSKNCDESLSVFGKVTAVLPWIKRTIKNCSNNYSSTCGITPKPRPPPRELIECDMAVLYNYDYYPMFIHQTAWIKWFNAALQRDVIVTLKCDWSLRCQVVKGGWSHGKTACEKICGYTTC